MIQLNKPQQLNNISNATSNPDSVATSHLQHRVRKQHGFTL